MDFSKIRFKKSILIILLMVVVPGACWTGFEKISFFEDDLPTSVQLDTVNIMRGLWNSIKLSLLGLVVLLVGLCLGPLELPVNVLYQSYAIGRGSFDIVVEKHAPRLRDRKIYYKNWRPEIWGHGLAYFLVLLVPVFGVLVAPVCSCAGLAALFFKQQRAPVARKMK